MIKTHNMTGLKYLCQTKKKDPHKYLGSGIAWRKHLTCHGKTIYTEILLETTNKQLLCDTGRYYSILWRITTAMDDFGNRIWANAIPETGGGGGGKIGIPRTELTKNKIRQNKPDQSGSKNGMFDKKHSDLTKIICGQSNKGKDLKSKEGKISIAESMKKQWTDDSYRAKQITKLKSRKGEKRSAEAIESYKHGARKRNEKMTPQQRSDRSRKAASTSKIKNAGMVRKRTINELGRISYIWSTPFLMQGKTS
jgi:hypothetical protein